MIRNALQKPKNEPIVFSSDDSMNTDNSFNSSIDGENNDDYKNSFWHLKEQMQQFFLQNPNLQDQMKFEPMKFDEDSEDDKNKKKNFASSQPQTTTAAHQQTIKKPKKENREKSKLWSTITKDIIKNGQFSSQVPTLETVNHRLNIFKKKLERVDYVEILSRETTANKEKKLHDKQQDQSQNDKKDKDEQNMKSVVKDSSEGNLNLNENAETQYYSFKKKMQQQLHKKREKLDQVLKYNKLKFQKQDDRPKHRTNIVMRGEDQAAMFRDRPNMIINDQLIVSKQKVEKKQAPKQEEIKIHDSGQQNMQLDKDIEFQSKFGQVLYQTLKQYQNDIESFKTTAIILLKDYNANKARLYKQKNFPPQINKFTSDETKSLNILLPDFSNPLFQSNKTNIFQGIENYQLPEGTAEAQFVQTIDKILNGKVLALWKEAQNNN